MLINNKIERSFEGPATLAGILFLAVGFYALSLNNFSIGNIIIGGFIIIISLFVIFTFSGVKVDTTQRKIKPYNKLFGIIETGKWQNLDSFKGLTLIPFKKVQRMASWSNQVTSSTKKDFRIFLVNQNNKPILAMKKCKTLEIGQNKLDEFAIWLKLPVYSIKR